MGRKALQLPIPDSEIRQRYLAGETAQELAIVCGVSDKVIYRRVQGVRKRKTYHQGTCLEPDCTEPTHARGYCQNHYVTRRLRGEFSTEDCSVDGCDRGAVSAGMCHAHHARHKRGQSLTGEIKAIAPKGSGSIDSNGYRRIGRKKEHRLVMEQMLGRPLRRNEHVHHVNGVKTDNRPENLELWVGRQQPKGRRVSDAVEAAVEILRLYAPELLLETWEEPCNR